MAIAKNDNTNYRLLMWGLLISVLLIGTAFIFLRTVDCDEGFYLSAASNIAAGQSPYLDFFFPQMPYIAVFLAPLAKFGMNSLFYARILGFICHIGLAFIIYQIAMHLFRERRLGLTALAVTLFAGPLLTWNSLAKPYFLCNLFLTASFLLLVLLMNKRQINYRKLFLSFLFLSITVNIRSIFVIFVPLYFFITWFYFRGLKQIEYKKYIPVILLGLIFPSLYSLKLLVSSPEYFLFNNLGFHLLREQSPGFLLLLQSKAVVLGKVLIQPQYLIILGLAIWSQFIINSHKYRNEYSEWQRMIVRLSLVMAAFIGMVYLIPHPVLVQYFNQALIFLIIAALPALKQLFVIKSSLRYGLMTVYLVGLLIYPALYIIDVRSMYGNYTIAHVKQVSEVIQANSSEQDVILSEWPGYNVFAQRRQVAGGEFRGEQYNFSSKLFPYKKYNLLSNNRINQMLKDQEPRLAVVNNYVIEEWKSELESNYQILEQIGNTYIYERKAEEPGLADENLSD